MEILKIDVKKWRKLGRTTYKTEVIHSFLINKRKWDGIYITLQGSHGCALMSLCNNLAFSNICPHILTATVSDNENRRDRHLKDITSLPNAD